MATFYVSAQTGNDSDDGTSVANAKATLQAGIDLVATAGDIVYVAPGTYRETVNCSNSVNGTAGDHVKIIGDPDCEVFVDEDKGIVRITACDANELHTQDSRVVYANKGMHEFHNFYVDGIGSDIPTATTFQNKSGMESSTDGRNLAVNCIVQNVPVAFDKFNTHRCVGMASLYAYEKGRKHTNSIGIASYRVFYQGDYCIDCIAVGGDQAGFQDIDVVIGCFSMASGNAGFRNASSLDITHDSISVCNQFGMLGTSATTGVISGSYSAMCLNAFYRGAPYGHVFGAGHYRSQTSTANFPYQDSSWAIGDNNTKLGPSMLFGYNNVRKIAEAMKPIFIPEGLRGTSTSDRDEDRNEDVQSYMQLVVDMNSQDILGHPRSMGNATASLHLMDDKMTARDLGPWEHSTVDFTASFSSSADGIKILGEGVQSFDIAVQSGSAFTASVGAKWTVTDSQDTTPAIFVQYATNYLSSSQLPGDTGNVFMTGSQRVITSSYGTAAANTWETIALEVPVSGQDQVYQLQLRSGNSGSSNITVFSDLEIS